MPFIAEPCEKFYEIALSRLETALQNERVVTVEDVVLWTNTLTQVASLDEGPEDLSGRQTRSRRVAVLAQQLTGRAVALADAPECDAVRVQQLASSTAALSRLLVFLRALFH